MTFQVQMRINKNTTTAKYETIYDAIITALLFRKMTQTGVVLIINKKNFQLTLTGRDSIDLTHKWGHSTREEYEYKISKISNQENLEETAKYLTEQLEKKNGKLTQTEIWKMEKGQELRKQEIWVEYNPTKEIIER